ncbi:MAG: hypothetical protein EOM26_09090 [Alphaproteobacteria bacterium]|nr:hypothetical protein [Alphaproteobacteria bacterium]
MINSYNPYDRYRSRTLHRIGGAFVTIAIIAVSMGVGYWLGQEKGKYVSAALQEENLYLKDQAAQAMETITQLRAEAHTASLRFERLQEVYTDEMGEGPLPGLVSLLRKQLEDGVRAERLESVIRSSLPPQQCSEPETAKAIVRTPAYSGADGTISVAEGSLLLSLNGESARNESGAPEAWFDPSLPVAVTLTGPEGATETKEGTLPLRHSVVVGDREFRFTFSEGAVSYVDITYDSCAYP